MEVLNLEIKAKIAKPELVKLPTEPEPLEIDLKRTAVIVIDMTNAFVKKGCFFDLLGVDISRCEKSIEPVNRVIKSARAKGCKIIHILHRYSPNLDNTGGPDSLNRTKEASLRILREHPEAKDRLYIRGTWGAQVIDEIKVEESDIIIEKPRYSAFAGTDLDMTLRGHDIKYVVIIGIATNQCVETSIRDAYNLEFWPILIPDACANTGPDYTQDTVIWNVKLCLGWVINSKDFEKALK